MFAKKTLAVALCAVMTFELSGCGTLLYPERRGQRAGTIDPAVAILDGIGCLFFVVPGLIAFAVDFATGGIYLPGGRRASLDGTMTDVVYVDKLDRATIERVVSERAGRKISLDDPRLQAKRVDNISAATSAMATASL